MTKDKKPVQEATIVKDQDASEIENRIQQLSTEYAQLQEKRQQITTRMVQIEGIVTEFRNFIGANKDTKGKSNE